MNALYLKGQLTIDSTDRQGHVIRLLDDHNLIVNNGLTVVCELLSQDPAQTPADLNPTYNKLAVIRLGGRTTGAGTPTVAVPDPTDTDIQGTLIANLPITTTAPIPGMYGRTYTALLDYGVGNGNDVLDCGLVCAGTSGINGRLFARRLTGVISKTNSISLTFAWRISVSVAIPVYT